MFLAAFCALVHLPWSMVSLSPKDSKTCKTLTANCECLLFIEHKPLRQLQLGCGAKKVHVPKPWVQHVGRVLDPGLLVDLLPRRGESKALCNKNREIRECCEILETRPPIFICTYIHIYTILNIYTCIFKYIYVYIYRFISIYI